MKQIIIFLLALACATTVQAQVIDLSGPWQCTLLDDAEGKPLPADKLVTTTVRLPGTTDTNGLGYAPADTTETTHLTRLHAYRGRARYERDIAIPRGWTLRGAVRQLFLERTKTTEIFIDGQRVGGSNDISTPQRFSLPLTKAGRHRLTIVVDNAHGQPAQVYAGSHAMTEDTQTNWNGVIGSMFIANVNRNAVLKADLPSKIAPIFKGFRAEGRRFMADGKPVFLRGKHDACVWPLTGHVAMDQQSWIDYMQKLQAYGINHIRFHSWCPPEQAFYAADSLGLYLQPELPLWGDFNDKDTVLMDFLHKEGVNMLTEYARHPSFVMMGLGNELWGSAEKMQEFVADFRRLAPEMLFTFGSNHCLGYQGVKPGMDYFTTCRVGGEPWGTYGTHTRGSFAFVDAADGGLINHQHPNTSFDFDEACRASNVPVISHETGQFQSFPDFDEAKKYTGVLRAYNIDVFRRRLERTGMLPQAKDFKRASGRWAFELYKADVEADLRTAEMAGFQLLDLQDYPGQGSAYVGMLDAFMDSKGFTTPEEWREFCSPVVPLLVSDKLCFRGDERLKAAVKVANYSGERFNNMGMYVQLTDETGRNKPLFRTIGRGATPLGLSLADSIDLDLSAVREPSCLTLELGFIDDTGMKQPGIGRNRYKIWVYPVDCLQETEPKGIVCVTVMDEKTVRRLEKGARVLWTPDSAAFAANTVGPLFQTDYWNYRMFKTISENNKKPVSPGTLGLLTDPKHPLFQAFPTAEHTDWQWFPVVKNSRPLVLDALPKAYLPIVQVIDNVERNHKLGLVMEFSVGRGKLLLCMSDLARACRYPEGRAFTNSLLRYMQSDAFRPASHHATFGQLERLLHTASDEAKMERLDNISQY